MPKRLALPALIGALLTGCAPAQLGATDEGAVTQASWADRAARWPASEDGVARISVCWETPGFLVEKQRVRDAIEGSWVAVAQVELTGWADCSAGAAEVRILVADDWPTVAYDGQQSLFGTKLSHAKDGVTLNLQFELWEPGWDCERTGDGGSHGCIEVYAMHEFGHVLGFLHEQDRPDAPRCDDGSEWRSGTDVADALALSDYDPGSVMNYCNPAPYALSALDIAGVQRWYGARVADARR